jgi:hypothetical protein
MILEHLKTGASIGQYEAIIEYGSLRLPAVIYDLRADGYNIETELIKSPLGRVITEYTLI